MREEQGVWQLVLVITLLNKELPSTSTDPPR